MTQKSDLLPFEVIYAASNGDVEAIYAVLKYYEGYITSLSTRRVYDEEGNGYTIIDDDLKRRLETKLITKILQFKIK
ncbi:MAG: helix-turn-helix domain-containing protein [Clostridia bacterium]|nr:helix-turn-helix domain-containing protein [Clostridia bacterium]